MSGAATETTPRASIIDAKRLIRLALSRSTEDMVLEMILLELYQLLPKLRDVDR